MDDHKKLKGKTALVTGASSGLGVQFSKVLASQGATVILAARRLDCLQSLAAEIVAEGGVAYPFTLDVADLNSISSGIDAMIKAVGDIDILVNNAGVANIGKIVDVTLEEYSFIMDVNVRGTFFVAQEVARRMIACSIKNTDRQFRIVNIASVCGLRAVEMPSVAIYGISKAAVIHMTKYMSSEWRNYNITVNAIAPGNIETPGNGAYFSTSDGEKLLDLLPRKRLGKPTDLDEILLLLAGDGSRFISGSVFNVDDGLMAL